MEVCVDTVTSAVNAVNGGARRLELCSCLSLGGLTPTVGLLRVVRAAVPSDCSLFAMIRPRPADFCYDETELAVMEEDVRSLKAEGADGFVFGCLLDSGEIDVAACRRLLSEASPLPCTFHRAFDCVPDRLRALPLLDEIGFRRILTSGGEEDAHAGSEVIRHLVDACVAARLRISIMPGGGVDVANLAAILEKTGVREFHGSARCKGGDPAVYLTSEQTVHQMMDIGRKFGCCYL